MAKDYARRRPQRRILHAGVASSRGSKRGGGNGNGRFKQFSFMIAGIFIGLVIAGFFYTKMQPMQVAAKTEKTTKVAQAKTKHTKVARQKVNELSAKKTEAPPRYDFYTILTKDKHDTHEEEQADENYDNAEEEAPESKITVTAEAKEEEPAAPKVAEVTPPKKAPANSPKYALQVAAFKKVCDADRMKARLLLQGHDVYISKCTIKNATWYRVNIGPYRTAANAKAQQRKLKEQHINSMLLTV